MPSIVPDPVIHRRSIRHFSRNAPDRQQIRMLLEAAMSAPSADDERPWHFVVVKERQILDQLSGISPHAGIVSGAPVCLVVCADESLQKQQGCWPLDCAAATENILIEAQILELGAIWLDIHPVEGKIQRVRAILGAPRNIIPFSLVPVGYPAEQKSPVSRYDEQRVHADRWVDDNRQVNNVSFSSF